SIPDTDVNSLPPSMVMIAKESMLLEHIKNVEDLYNDKIYKFNYNTKIAAEFAGTFEEGYLLRSQRQDINYSDDPDLADRVVLQQGGPDCGMVCVQMIAADENKDFSKKWSEVEKIIEASEKHMPNIEETGGETTTDSYPGILEEIKHPVGYRY